MAHEQHRSPAARNFGHLPQALFLEIDIADGQHLVDHKYLWLQMRRDSKGKAHIHSAGVALDRRIEKLLHLGEGDDFVELAPDLGMRHAEDGTVEVDVLAAGELRMKSG